MVNYGCPIGSLNSAFICEEKTMSRQIIMIVFVTCLLIVSQCLGEESSIENPRIVTIADGWAGNSINAVIFRRNSVVTDGDYQYVAFYDEYANVVLAKRQLGTDIWEIQVTRYQGNVTDAHNSISIMVDGDGFLHVSWNHHVSPLCYCQSIAPGSLELTDMMSMTGIKEQYVTYPEFYRLPDGNLIFLYRDGSSGRGDLIMNYYDTNTKTWTQLQNNLIDGQRRRNAYWQTTIDIYGVIHISWVWRESSDVATNHDICYAKSDDGGLSWQKSTGEKYELPITADSAEYACRIPQRSELINQTSMCADSYGRPYIATYWRLQDSNVPQYHLVYHDGIQWHTVQVSQRTTPFSLSGGGTKRIPISRPQIVADVNETIDKAYMIFRDIERGDKVSIAICDDLQLAPDEWRFEDLTSDSVSQWEPSYDTELWTLTKTLHIFVQKVGQGEGETIEDIPPQPVSILEWTPLTEK